jgi:beta-lactamase class A
MLRAALTFGLAVLTASVATAPLRAQLSAPPFARLQYTVRRLAAHLPGVAAVDVLDLGSGASAGFNPNESMPAASTIKIPVMVEVFEQLEEGRFSLDRRVTLLERDKDWGSGDLCDAPDGTTYPVFELLDKMIDISDNTAANMLIRLVGRRRINRTMRELGLRHTYLTDDVRTAGWAIRRELRTSPADLVRLLALMARRELVDEWSSNEMISILSGDQYNSMLPEPLPADVLVAHKTGSLFDTLNDAGIVYAQDAPYVIAVMTTELSSEDAGMEFIHAVSSLAYRTEARLGRWREAMGITPEFVTSSLKSDSPDLRYWSGGLQAGAGGG